MSTITWHDPKKERPALHEGVILAVEGETEASEGFRTRGNHYRFADGHEATGVYAWALMPLCPPRPAVLKPLRTRSVKSKGGRA